MATIPGGQARLSGPATAAIPKECVWVGGTTTSKALSQISHGTTGLQVHAHTGQVLFIYFYSFSGGSGREQKMEENELRSSQGQPTISLLFTLVFFFFFFLFLFAAFCFYCFFLRTYPLYMLIIMHLLASTILKGMHLCLYFCLFLFASDIRTGMDPDAGHWYIARWLGKAIQQHVSQPLIHVPLRSGRFYSFCVVKEIVISLQKEKGGIYS